MDRLTRERLSAAELRRTAEAVFSARRPAPPSQHETQALLHELGVHQIELEMQNEQLRQTQVDLEVSRDRYAALYDNAPVGYLTIDRDGKIIECNLTCAELLGRDRNRLLGINLYSLMYPRDADAFHVQQLALLRGGKQSCEVDLARADGSRFRARLDSVADVNVAMGPRSNIAVVDMTELREARADLEVSEARFQQIAARQVADEIEHRRQEERMAEADRRKNEFLAMLGHELRNPLAPILTATELMAMRGGGALEGERKVIERQAKHLIRLVDDLLDVSRITRGKIELRKEPTALAQIVAKAVEMASPLLEQRCHQLATDVPMDLIVDVDPARMVQVVANLLTNAATYTNPGGQIRLTGEATEETVTLRVADTGVGIASTMLPFVFEPFVQEKQPLDRARGGLGLGLAIVKSLVELHGGTVHAHSEGPGKGSEFGFMLARSRRNEQPSAGSSPAIVETGARGARILIVDDNDDMAQAFGSALTALGHEVQIAHDGPQALRIIETFTPTVALLDIGLPVMDGYELARRLRQFPTLSSIRLIAVTGYGEPPAVQRSSEAGFEAHLVKPVQLGALDKAIRGDHPASAASSSDPTSARVRGSV